MFSGGREIRPTGTNLREDWVMVQSDPQRLDTDFRVAVSAFPDISKAAIGRRFVPDSGEIAGYDVRRREFHAAATDGL